MTININGTEYQGPLYLSDTGAMVLDAKGVVFLNFMQQTEETRPKVQAMIAALNAMNAMNTTQGEYGELLEIKGDGRQLFVKNGGIVADCACQWANDDDEAGLEQDEERNFKFANRLRDCFNACSGMADPAERMNDGEAEG